MRFVGIGCIKSWGIVNIEFDIAELKCSKIYLLKDGAEVSAFDPEEMHHVEKLKGSMVTFGDN